MVWLGLGMYRLDGMGWNGWMENFGDIYFYIRL